MNIVKRIKHVKLTWSVTTTMTLPLEIIDSLQFYNGENENLSKVFPEVTKYIHDLISYDSFEGDPRMILKLRINESIDLEPFKNLQVLFCSCNELQELLELPSSLQELYCSDNKIQELPKLPSGLRELFCYNNQLQELPKLPSSLRFLDCNSNRLVNKDSLIEYCQKNKISYLI